MMKDTALPEEGHGFDHDLVVIGGGSGGLAAAKRAKEVYGVASVALCDYVNPSPQGTKWGIGGTCVNVGCIPKKLMHTAALQGEFINHAGEAYGWGAATAGGVKTADWDTLKGNVTMHIRSLNFGYNVELRTLGIKYYNALATFTDNANTLLLTQKDGTTSKITARRIIMAMGGRPTYPDIPGAWEYGVTSDDLFRLPNDPGKMCVVGASYVALECAGFLKGIGRDTTVLIRSIPLRGYDTDMANRVVDYMEQHSGVRFLRRTVPTKVEKTDSGKLILSYKSEDGTTGSEEYDTVLFAIGRTAETGRMNLDVAGIKTNPKNGKVFVNPKTDATDAPHVYAIGDIVEGGLELTPVAIRAGRLLIDRLYGNGTKSMDYDLVPTTVFTPLEYGCVGLSEEVAIERFGEAEVEVYHTATTPLEWTVPHLPSNVCYFKLICVGEMQRVVGFHVLGPNAGEITQGVGVALRAGATKETFDDTVGIHPTLAEDMTLLTITKRSGLDAAKSGC
eukprot:PhM_4_TR11688/c0_g1_i1/m.76129/K22182/TXNRD; thioredoxin reductase (NADPH)